MEISDLKTFVTVAEEGTATRAARVLGMTQPGVSKHLARLEFEIGTPLFKRQGKYLVLNEFGEFFLKEAKKILLDVDSLRGMASGKLCPIGSLKLGLTDASTLLILPTALAKFHKCYPGIHIRLDVESSHHIEEGVLEGKYDIGVITAGLNSHPQLEEAVLYHDHIDALLCPEHPLATRKRISLKELAEQTLIISPERRRTRELIDKAFAAHDISLSDVIDVYINTAAVRLAEAGLGVALLPRAFITKQMPQHDCAHLRITGDPIKRTLCMIRRRENKKPSEAANFFYNMVVERCRQM